MGIEEKGSEKKERGGGEKDIRFRYREELRRELEDLIVGETDNEVLEAAIKILERGKER